MLKLWRNRQGPAEARIAGTEIAPLPVVVPVAEENVMSRSNGWLKRAALGAAAGFAGTMALQLLRSASARWRPESLPHLREDPGRFMVRAAEQALPSPLRHTIPAAAETAAAQSLALGYGLAFGAAYVLLRPEGGPRLADGVALGLAAWAAGYLGWLPALDLMEPVWQQEAEEALAPAVRHALYGLTTVAAYDLLHEYV
jgi:hypothetical protein